MSMLNKCSIDYNLMLNAKTNEINKMLDEFLPAGKTMINGMTAPQSIDSDVYLKSIFEAVNYSIRNGGKRIRPMLMLECFLIFSEGDSLKEEAYKMLPGFISAIEMIHSYSLVHDDLPAMDNDMYRRGKLTTHAEYGEAIGILAGDGLLNLAYESVARAFENISDTCELYKRFLKALNILGRKSGIYGMVGGQAIDIAKNGEFTSLDELLLMYRLKTAALLEASMTIGAVLGGADDGTVEELRQAAEDIGIAFQIQDDILDVTGDEALIGKPVKSDEKNKKTTFVTLYSLEGAAKESERLSKRAIDIIKRLTDNSERNTSSNASYVEEKLFLLELITNLIYRKK